MHSVGCVQTMEVNNIETNCEQVDNLSDGANKKKIETNISYVKVVPAT